MKKITGIGALDFALIIMPIWFALVLHGAFIAFADYAPAIFLLVLFVCGETHFAATWLFVFDPKNRKWLLGKPLYSMVIPVGLVGLLLAVVKYGSLEGAILLSTAFSAFHVTRQSVGVTKLYGQRGSRSLKAGEMLIYAFSVMGVGIGFMRLHFPHRFPAYADRLQLGPESAFMALTIGAAMLMAFAYMVLLSRREGQSPALPMSVLTGMFLYFPYTFVSRIEYCAAACVGMHYVQYLGIVVPLYYRKGKQARKAGEAGLFAKIIGNSMWMLLYLFVYSAVMLLMRQGTGKLGYNTFEYSGLILIPVIFQTLHYYAEMFIWRFSNTHIRQEIGMYLLSDSANTPRAGRS